MLLARHYGITPTQALYERPAWELDLLLAALPDGVTGGPDDSDGIDMDSEG